MNQIASQKSCLKICSHIASGVLRLPSLVASRTSTLRQYRLPATRVGDVMTTSQMQSIVTCKPDILVDDALKLIVNTKVTGLPVVDDLGKVVGVVTEFDLMSMDIFGGLRGSGESRDHLNSEQAAEAHWQVRWCRGYLLSYLYSPGNKFVFVPDVLNQQPYQEVKKVLSVGTGVRVSEVMTSSPITVTPHTDLNEATRILLQNKVRRLPVLDSEGRLLGSLSRRDILKAAFEDEQQK
ncbi:hypothetical protein CEUSTIGMA_g6435.t1 [Chlamydomonas eustigma]|uniref:CBS domain-containing protein n=1 Tax=Chlamydomonas eustigma TaxID=1157962 RepID=A0A250X7F8_9CHLO|nr:hypothetical protein CEUSTIGMA_g6435.t1 [Chlamydomonas eustigma]|eukprot:GAX78995.1 hypothetical protein CEUSTIGMA_g6435.t1 [Chlamydomonas eustigma]